jgi:hypothetical protein
MPRTKEDWQQIGDAASIIRSHGCAVLILSPEDVATQIAWLNDDEDDEKHIEAAESFLDRNRNKIEDRLSELGNEVADTFLSMEGVPE